MNKVNGHARHRHTFLAGILFFSALFAAFIISACSYGSNYTDEYLEELHNLEIPSSSSTKYSSSSGNSSSSQSSSSRSYSDNREDEADTTVHSPKDLTDSCKDGITAYVEKDSSIYHCAYDNWFKETNKIPECTDSIENSTFYKNAPYICKAGKWIELEELEARFGFCSAGKKGKIITFQDKQYRCDSLSWTKLDITDIHGKCVESKYGDTLTFEDTLYLCRNNAWGTLTSIDQKFGICNKARSGEVRITTDYKEDVYFICKNFVWENTVDYVTILGSCDSTKADSISKVFDTYYVCSKTEWRELTSTEIRHGVCNEKRQDSVITLSVSSHLICSKGEWRDATAEDFYGSCTEALQDTLYYIDEQPYVCNNKKWEKIPYAQKIKEYCTKKNEGEKYITDSDKYVMCHNYVWTDVDSLSYVIGICDKANLSTKESIHKDSLQYQCKETSSGMKWIKLTIDEEYGECNDANQDVLYKGYVCDNGSWRNQQALEKILGKICTQTNLNSSYKGSSNYYKCTPSGWSTITAKEYYLGECDAEKDSLVGKYNGTEYLCSEGEWITPSITATPSTSVCSYYDRGKLGVDDKKIYICPDHPSGLKWEYVGEIAQKYGVCNGKRKDNVVIYNDKYVYCSAYMTWKSPTLPEILQAFPCGEKDVYGQKYSCSGDSWTPVYGTLTDTRNNKTYKTITIGEQIWMAENLNYETVNSWCFMNNSDNCTNLGRLYTWENVKTACPTGWHVPTRDEYEVMSKNALKIELVSQDDSWQDKLFTSNATFIPGLELKGTGIRLLNGNFEYDHRVGAFWLADTANVDSSYYVLRNTYSSSKDISSWASYQDNSYGLSIRCIKDK